jgi:hypothetical protein
MGLTAMAKGGSLVSTECGRCWEKGRRGRGWMVERREVAEYESARTSLSQRRCARSLRSSASYLPVASFALDTSG